MTKKKQPKKKQPGIVTIRELVKHVEHYCSCCDVDDCGDPLSHLYLTICDLSGVESKTYDYSEPFVTFVCHHANLSNFSRIPMKTVVPKIKKKTKSKP
jgi:hypothetical protein